MKYTFTAKTTATYSLNATIASAVGTGKCRVELDGVALATIAIPNTRGWSSWEALNLTNLKITAGVHTLKFIVDTEGFNLKRFEFTVLTPTDEVGLDLSPKLRVFPSVADDFITIEYPLLKSDATVKIGTIDGRIMATKTLSEGSTNAKVDVSALNQGFYLLILESGSKKLITKFVKP